MVLSQKDYFEEFFGSQILTKSFIEYESYTKFYENYYSKFLYFDRDKINSI